MSKEEVFLRDVKKNKKNFRINFQLIFQKILQDQKWVYYPLIGSFVLLIILNNFIPITVEVAPYNFESGFLGMTLTFFGVFCLINLMLLEIGKGTSTLSFIFTCSISLVLSIVLLYFGLPLFLGFNW